MFELLLEAHNNCIVVPRKERKRVHYEINRLKRIRKAKTLAAPTLDWNFLRLSMFPKREDNAVEKLKFISFEGEEVQKKEKNIKNATNSKYKEKISSIRNDKIKKSLIEMSKYFKKK